MKTEIRFADFDGFDRSTNPIQMIQSLIFEVANNLHVPKRFRKGIAWNALSKEKYITELQRYLTNAKMRASLN